MKKNFIVKIKTKFEKLNIKKEKHPIDHYSYSMWRSFLENPVNFQIKYINKENIEYTTGGSAVLGSAIHIACQVFLGKLEKGQEEFEMELLDKTEEERINIAIEKGLLYIADYNDVYIKYSKTQLRNKQEISEAFSFCFQEYLPFLKTIKYEDIWSVEDKIETNIKLDKLALPIPVKGIMDLVYEDKKGNVIIVDHKVVNSFSNEDEIDGGKLIQAGFYYFLALKKCEKAPKKIVFNEIKRSKNKDESPQIKSYELDYKNEMIFELFFKLYFDITKFIFEGQAVYVPNINSMFDKDISLLAYIQGLNENETKDKVFKKENVQNLTEYLNKQVDKKGVDKVYQKVAKEFVSTNNLINIKNMKIEDKIKSKLQQFGILVKFIEKINGLQVDSYLFDLNFAIKLSKIKGYKEDLELALGVGGITMYRDGNYLAVDIPKSKREFIEFKKHKFKGKFVVGLNKKGQEVEIDLDKSPHTLIGGTTGSGKSVLMKTLIKQAEKLGKVFILDPKGVDYLEFENVITEKEKIELKIQEMVLFMEDEYKKMKKAKVIKNKNKTFIFIDEFADLSIGENGKEILLNLQKLAQKGRSAGIHLVLATQRPSVKIIQGDIKANFNNLIGLKLPKPIDSEVILGEEGAENLLGYGDGLINLEGKMIRFQGFNL